MATLKSLFSGTPPITHDFNPPTQSRDILGLDMPYANGQPNAVGVPQPQTLYDLGSYPTPFRWLWRRPRNVLTG